MKELVEAIAKALVDYPEAVQVKAVEGQQVTQTAFIHKAQQVDRDKGLIRNVTSKSFQFSGNAQQATIQMNVTRGQKSYVVTLQLKSEGNTWKIMSADGI